jgi:hypothetical protein
MKVHIIKPFDTEKKLGRAYNEAMRLLPDEDWACLCDLDTMFLTPDAGTILHEYAKIYDFAGMLTCFTNRIHPLQPDQLLDGTISQDANVSSHIEIAEKQKAHLYKVTVIDHIISGFLMMVSKRTWNETKFTETGKCLGVDNTFSANIRARNKDILRMDGLYVWHTYRLKNGITDKSHLQ